jgi:hypothetical protein
MRTTVPALTALLLFAPLALAAQSLVLGEALAPAFDGLDGALLGMGAVLPAAEPLLGAGRSGLGQVRGVADQSVVGAEDGDVGTHLGAPGAVGAEHGLDGGPVGVPATPVGVGGHALEATTPSFARTVRAPGFQVPGHSASIPEQSVGLGVPAVRTPPVILTLPGASAGTPGLAVPDVEIASPPVDTPGVQEEADLDEADLNVQELRGTLYLGPHAVPYHAGPFGVGEDNLPEAVPRSWSLDVPARRWLPAQPLWMHRGGEVLASTQHEVPGQDVLVAPGAQVFPGVGGGSIVVPGLGLTTPGLAVPSQERSVIAPAHRIVTPVLPGASAEVPAVVLLEEGPAAPPLVVAEPLGPEGLGYVGYGRAGDSSLYPFACTAGAGCLRLADLAGPWVRQGDAALDAAARALDGDLVLVLPA